MITLEESIKAVCVRITENHKNLVPPEYSIEYVPGHYLCITDKNGVGCFNLNMKNNSIKIRENNKLFFVNLFEIPKFHYDVWAFNMYEIQSEENYSLRHLKFITRQINSDSEYIDIAATNHSYETVLSQIIGLPKLKMLRFDGGDVVNISYLFRQITTLTNIFVGNDEYVKCGIKIMLKKGDFMMKVALII